MWETIYSSHHERCSEAFSIFLTISCVWAPIVEMRLCRASDIKQSATWEATQAFSSFSLLNLVLVIFVKCFFVMLLEI